MDSMRLARADASASQQMVNGRTFTLTNGVWTDSKPAGSNRVVTVRAYSAAYFDLMKKIPDLASVFSIGEQVRVVGKGIVVEVRTDSGVQTLSDADILKVVRDR